MISLPGSGSELFNARALLLGANRLRLFHWHRGRLSDSGLIEASAEARANFKAYLAAQPAEPIYLLVDVAEEEFRPETIPEARGADRKALIRRKQARLFGPGARVYAERQGYEQRREPGGRRAERLLFMALSGRSVIEPWVELLCAQKVPLQGILSVPALLQSLLRRLPDIAPHALLLTRQSVSGWRQSFFANGQLKASRLGPPADPGGPPAALLLAEIEQFRRYLASLRLMPEGQPLDVYVLADPALQRALARAPGRPPELRLHDLDLGRLERQRALRPQPGPPCCDRLLLQHLFRTRPANRYASAAERRYASLATARRAIHAGAVLLLLGGLIHGGLNVINGLGYRQAAAEFAGQAGRYRAAQEQARALLPETAPPPGAIRAAVASAARLRQDRATPREALALLGGALARFPDIQPLTIAWAHGPAMDAPAAADAASADGPRYRQSLRLEARIEPFAGDYRAAILRVRAFARALRALAPVRAVEIEALPLDLSPEAVLQGSGGGPAGAAPFALKAQIGAD